MGSRHPVAERDDSGYKRNKKNNYRAKLGFDIKIPYVDGLKFNALFSYVRGANHSKSFLTPYSLYLLGDDGMLPMNAFLVKPLFRKKCTLEII